MAELRELARAAKSERWYGPDTFASLVDDDGESVFEVVDGLYIAAMSPDVTLVLLDERDRLRDRLEALEKAAKDVDGTLRVHNSDFSGLASQYPAVYWVGMSIQKLRAALRGGQ